MRNGCEKMSFFTAISIFILGNDTLTARRWNDKVRKKYYRGREIN